MEVEIKPGDVTPNSPRSDRWGAASQGDDGVGSANCPEHPRLFEAGTDDGFAASLDNAGTEQFPLVGLDPDALAHCITEV